jgi:hypothetical protein
MAFWTLVLVASSLFFLYFAQQLFTYSKVAAILAVFMRLHVRCAFGQPRTYMTNTCWQEHLD